MAGQNVPRRAGPASSRSRSLFADHPLRWGFTVALGVLGAILLAAAVVGIRSVILTVFVSAFVALGLDPLVRWFQRRGMNRPLAIVVVLLLFVVLGIAIVWAIVPPMIAQTETLVTGLPDQVKQLQSEDWFTSVNDATNGAASAVMQWLNGVVTSPGFWSAVWGGAVTIGLAVFDAVSSGFFIFILSIYFIATLDTIKQGCYSLVAASHRESFVSYAERITLSVGRYLSGMVILAFINAVFAFFLLTLVGVPYAIILAVVALFVTLIPLIGVVLLTVVMSLFSFLTSLTAGLIVLLVMLVYMQIASYVLTPRVMGKAVQVPGSVVLISALAGGALLGLLGALVAIPISAGIMLIIREIVVPRKALT